MIHPNWHLIRAKLKEAVFVLPHFFKNPVKGMRMLPDWDWPTMLILQGAFALACSTLADILDRDILGIFTGIVLAPLRIYVIAAVAAGFFFYTFMFFFKREVPYRQVYLHLIFAAVPAQILSIVASMAPPAYLIGIASTCLLLYVGFVENFHMDRKKTRNLLGGLFALFAIAWTVSLIRTSSRHESQRMKATPESMDILEKELGFGK